MSIKPLTQAINLSVQNIEVCWDVILISSQHDVMSHKTWMFGNNTVRNQNMTLLACSSDYSLFQIIHTA